MDESDHDRVIRLEAVYQEFRASLDLRLIALNELRDAVVQDRADFLRRDVYEQNHLRLEESARKEVENLRTSREGVEATIRADIERIAAALRAELDRVDQALTSGLAAAVKRIESGEKWRSWITGGLGAVVFIIGLLVVIWEAIRK